MTAPSTHNLQDVTGHSRRQTSLPLWIKILISFILVAVVAVGVVAILANRSTTRQFEVYVSQGRQMRAEQLAPTLAAFYALNGSWQGVAGWLNDLDGLPTQSGGQGRGQGQGRGRGWNPESDRLLLVGTGGQVIVDTRGDLAGVRLPEAQLELAAPVQVDGETVGYLLIPSAEGIHETQETEFLGRVNQSLLLAGLIAGLVALVLGLLLARQLTAPLRALTDASQRLAEGELPQVEVRTGDEIGDLAQAFNQMARSLNRQETLRRNLMADIAHELRTPLTVMRGDLEALLDGVFEPTPEALGSLQEETLLLARLVEDLGLLAKAEAGQLQLQRHPFPVEEMLQTVIDSFDLQAQSRSQVLALDVAPNLPLVAGDPQRIRQVVANLVSNALRHAPEKGQVELSASALSGEVQICVENDGPGIAPEDLNHVFDRFWRGGGSRAEGSGLGLTIAHELVRAHGGRIWATSEPGKNTTFCFTLQAMEEIES